MTTPTPTGPAQEPSDTRLSERIEGVRRHIVTARNALDDTITANPEAKERVKCVEGLLTCGLIALHSLNEEFIEWEIKRDNFERGSSLVFRPRGIGLDVCPCCFVCGAEKRSPDATLYLNNIAAFTDSRGNGEEIVRWFERGARLDFRSTEPNWIQVKVGACDAHVANLEHLLKATSRYGLIRARDIKEAIERPPAAAQGELGK